MLPKRNMYSDIETCQVFMFIFIVRSLIFPPSAPKKVIENDAEKIGFMTIEHLVFESGKTSCPCLGL